MNEFEPDPEHILVVLRERARQSRAAAWWRRHNIAVQVWVTGALALSLVILMVTPR